MYSAVSTTDSQQGIKTNHNVAPAEEDLDKMKPDSSPLSIFHVDKHFPTLRRQKSAQVPCRRAALSGFSRRSSCMSFGSTLKIACRSPFSFSQLFVSCPLLRHCCTSSRRCLSIALKESTISNSDILWMN
uniref:Uncharacterized protein n=1 Tax=Opuntia streptacantha TaxID=393608 RepID=A0A7C9EZ62_OPUST